MRRLLTIVSIGGVALALSGVALELLMRVRPNWITQVAEPKYQRVLDGNIGWYLKPDQRIVWGERGGPIYVENIHTNAYGMRDKNRDKMSQAERYLLLGDSILRSFEVALDSTFFARLERATDIEMLNFGESGHGTTQAYGMYAHRAREFSATDVVYFFYSDDFLDNNRYLRSIAYNTRWIDGRRVYPKAPLAPYTLAPTFERSDAVPDSLVFVPGLNALAGLGTAVRLKQWLKSEFHLLRLLDHVKDTLLGAQPDGAATLAEPRLDSTPTENPAVFYLFDRDTSPMHTEMAFRQLRKSIRELHLACSRDGRKLAVVYIPQPTDYLSLDEIDRLHIKCSLEPIFNEEVKAALRKACEEESISFYDPTPFFLSVRDHEGLAAPYFVFGGGVHFNESGHLAMAEYLRRHVIGTQPRGGEEE